MQRSTILVALNDFAPPSGGFLNALRRVDPIALGPRPRGGRRAARPGDRRGSRGRRRRARSVVRVTGSACGLGVEGSGWIAGPGIVVTNAHVVAGQDDTQVTTTDGTTLDAGGASLRAAGRPRRPRRAPGSAARRSSSSTSPRKGTASATVGYPEGGPLTLTPARLGQDRHGREPGLLRPRARSSGR